MLVCNNSDFVAFNSSVEETLMQTVKIEKSIAVFHFINDSPKNNTIFIMVSWIKLRLTSDG